MRFAICPPHLSKVLRLPRKSDANSNEVLHVSIPKSAPKLTFFLNILTSKCASRHNSVQFFISHLARWLRTRRFSEPTFRPSTATSHWKNTVNRDFSAFSRTFIFFLLTLSLGSFSWLFLLTLSLLWSSLFFSSLLLTSLLFTSLLFSSLPFSSLSFSSLLFSSLLCSALLCSALLFSSLLFSSLLFSSLLVSSRLVSSLLFSSLTLPTSAFPSVHIVRSLTSKFPSIVLLTIQNN